MSWLGVAIGLSIAAIFITLIVLVLWLFPNDGQPSKRIKRQKYERTLCTYQLQGDVEMAEKEEKYKQGVTLTSCFKCRRENERRSTIPGMDPSSNFVDDSQTIVLEIDGEDVPTNVRFNGEDSISATLQFNGPDHSVPHLRNGNMNDIGKAGSLHEFLMGLHKQFGPIASFWWGTQFTVSIASPELFKQHQQLSDRPGELFRMFEPLITRHSIQYANGADMKLRRQAYDKVFSHEAIGFYFEKLQKTAEMIACKWDHAEADDHFPLGEHMFLFSVKAALVCLMGETFYSEKDALAFKNHYEAAWKEMEERLVDPVIPKENSERGKNFKTAVNMMRDIMKNVIKTRAAHGRDSRDFLLIDAIVGHNSGDEDVQFADAISYTVGGFHTTANLLTWCMYYLCMHEDVQDKVYKEILDVLGKNDPVSEQSLGKLKYLRQVLDETLRCAVVAPWAARYSDEDMELDGHKIPAGTPVIHALGVLAMDEKLWPAPTVFDPDRFSEKRNRGRPIIAFSPFGFAGGRMCPGYRFTYIEASVILVTALQRFKFMLVPGQDVKPSYGLVTHPKEEIWFKVAKRD